MTLLGGVQHREASCACGSAVWSLPYVRLSLAALEAATFQEDLGHFAQEWFFRSTFGLYDLHFHAVEAGDFAAIDAHEVGMLSRFVMIAATKLKTPAVIPNLQPREDIGVGQLDQAAIDGRFVESFGDEHFCHIGVAQWFASDRHMLQHSHARRGAPEPCATQHLAGFFNGKFGGCCVHNKYSMVEADRAAMANLVKEPCNLLRRARLFR